MSAEERGNALIDERELAAALRGLRPDPDAFRAAVERRIREAETNAGGARPEAGELRAADGTWWRRAAAWLPGELVPASLAATGAKFSWKAVPGLLALPALAFAMLAAPVFFALQTLGSETGERGREQRAAVRAWWREHRRAALLTLAAIGLVFLREPASAGVALLLVSTGVLALLLTRLRAAGFGRRADVARHCANLLFPLAFWMGMIAGPWQALLPSERARHLGFFALAFGGVACALVALRAKHPTAWHVLTHSKAADALLLLQIALLAPLSLMSLWAGLTDLGRVDWVQSVQQLRPFGNEQWEAARKTVAHFQRTGEAPELTRLRAHWLQQRNDGHHERSRAFLAAGVDLGFVDEDELKSLANDARREWLDADGPIPGDSLRERADLLALARSGTISPAEREQFGRRLVASWDGGETPWVIERLVTVAELLDEIGLREQADALRPEALALLRRCWVPDDGLFFCTAGFVAPFFGRDGAYAPNTLDAIDLMRRFGVPPEIDLGSVRRALREDLHRPLPWQRPGPYRWPARLALSELERELLPPQGWPGILAENRVLLAMVALAIFCIAATLRAPPEPFLPTADAPEVG